MMNTKRKECFLGTTFTKKMESLYKHFLLKSPMKRPSRSLRFVCCPTGVILNTPASTASGFTGCHKRSEQTGTHMDTFKETYHLYIALITLKMDERFDIFGHFFMSRDEGFKLLYAWVLYRKKNLFKDYRRTQMGNEPQTKLAVSFFKTAFCTEFETH